MVAGRWTLADRSGAPLLAACVERGVSVVAAAPFNSGLLARPYPPTDARFDYGPAPADVLTFARRLADACATVGVALPDAALQFPLRHPAVASVVVGMRTADEARANVAALRRPLPDDAWSALALLDQTRPAALRGHGP
jgi:D-threo-aldose 1-dehydrogenase